MSSLIVCMWIICPTAGNCNRLTRKSQNPLSENKWKREKKVWAKKRNKSSGKSASSVNGCLLLQAWQWLLVFECWNGFVLEKLEDTLCMSNGSVTNLVIKTQKQCTIKQIIRKCKESWEISPCFHSVHISHNVSAKQNNSSFITFTMVRQNMKPSFCAVFPISMPSKKLFETWNAQQILSELLHFFPC